MLLGLGEPPVRFLGCFSCCSFHFWSAFCCCIFICRCSSFCCCSSFTFSFRRHPSPFRGLSPGFYTHFILSAQPIAEWFATLSFFDHSILPRALRPWVGTFYPQAFFTLRSFTDILTCVYQCFPRSSSSSKFTGLHTDPWNTDSSHLFDSQ